MRMEHADAQPIRILNTDVQDILRGMAWFLPFLKFSKSEKDSLLIYLCLNMDYFLLPETKGKTFAEIEKIFAKKE